LPAVLPHLARLWGCGIGAAAITWAVRVPWLGAGGVPRRLEAVGLLLVFAASYGALTLLLQVPEAVSLRNRVLRRRVAAS
jgi:hypothetical protein